MELAEQIDRALRAAATAERAVKEKAYLKSALQHYGTTVPATRKAVAALLRAHPGLDRAAILGLAEALWERPVHERRSAAVMVLEAGRARLVAADLALVERLLRESRTWALVDELATGVAGPLVERFPALGKRLDRWARDPDFWIRRAALLALLVPLRAGDGDFERFGRYADTMLEEKEFFIRKAIGWVLRDVSRKRPQLVAAWLAPRRARASGVTLREALKYLPGEPGSRRRSSG